MRIMKKIIIVCLVMCLLTGCAYGNVKNDPNDIYDNTYKVEFNNPIPESMPYEIPEEYKTDVLALIDIIESSEEGIEYYVLDYEDPFEAFIKINEYLAIYYSDGFEQLYPECGFTCMFFHNTSNTADNKTELEIDLEHCSKVKKECAKVKETALKTRTFIDETFETLDVNGNVVHDLKLIHDYILTNVDYNREFDNVYNTSILGMIEGQELICQGYSDAMFVLCDAIGLNCFIDGGYYYDIGHAWNYVIIDDTVYYIDATWDDGEVISDEFFLVDRAYMEETGHIFN